MSTKKTTKKPTKKIASKNSANGRKPNPIHDALVKLFTQPNGATITDIKAAKFNAPTIQALR
ncbi:hypothetical protein [Caballeronia mineralivorans]|jgi:hypothetical protein|uniref:hypothetical protein n=1 Tax=Caballeronia mineralivorans TaxID=2010198 RepID=UPI002AFF93DC|nr:hypothetical protein [Caballeronia mineralivorans]MEA3100146.1 hypothetical protein [Caballeronia mineralivorans]